MSKNNKNNKNNKNKKQNKPYYINDFGHKNMENTTIQNPKIIKKFLIGKDKNFDAIVTIDNVMHFINKKTYETFVYKCQTVLNEIKEHESSVIEN